MCVRVRLVLFYIKSWHSPLSSLLVPEMQASCVYSGQESSKAVLNKRPSRCVALDCPSLGSLSHEKIKPCSLPLPDDALGGVSVICRVPPFGHWVAPQDIANS